MNKNMLIGGAVVIALIGVIGFKSMSKNQSGQTSDVKVNETSVNEPSGVVKEATVGASMEAEVKKIEVEAANYSFDVKQIKVKKGETIKIVLLNKEGFHDLVLDEFNVKTKQSKAGESETIEFTPDKVGTFEYYCSVGKHRQMGMVGQLIVE